MISFVGNYKCIKQMPTIINVKSHKSKGNTNVYFKK